MKRIIFAFILSIVLCTFLVVVTAIVKLVTPQTRPEDIFIIWIFFYLAWKELK
jgi:hypothetical protein